jgi:predicted O-methyltransferase YrrM
MSDKMEGRPLGSASALSTYDSLDDQGLATRMRVRVIQAVRARRNRAAEQALRRHPALWAAMEDYARASNVTGASFSDYWTLYDEVRRWKPVEVLECGTGISTLVLAQALIDNQQDGAPPGRLTSVEDDTAWFERARDALPAGLEGTVDLVNIPKTEGLHRIFRGVRYEYLPDRPYDFVFSDGPDRRSPVTGEKLFNLDLIEVIARSDRPVRAVVDNHYLTFYILQKLLGTDKARYDVWRKLMFVGPVTRNDLGYLRRENFLPDVRLMRRTELKLRLTRPGDDRP